MKQLICSIVIGLCIQPVLAQDIDLGLGGDVGNLLSIPAPRGNAPARSDAAAARGTSPARGAAANGPPIDRLMRLRELLLQANMPLSKEQEAGLDALVNSEISAMRQALQRRVIELQKTRGGEAAGGDARRAGLPPANLPSIDELAPEIVRLNDQLLGKISDASVLTVEQRTLIKKIYKDQVKSRGGFDAIRLTMEDAGAPFSADQIAQIQPLFDQQNAARLQLIREAQGQPPDKAKLDELQRDTLAKVLKLLTAPQRAALLAK